MKYPDFIFMITPSASHILHTLSCNLVRKSLLPILFMAGLYTKVVLINHPQVGLIWDVEPWQFIFEEMALPVRAPFLYRLCELAVRHWDYNG